jgi:hypothetical protein
MLVRLGFVRVKALDASTRGGKYSQLRYASGRTLELPRYEV